MKKKILIVSLMIISMMSFVMCFGPEDPNPGAGYTDISEIAGLDFSTGLTNDSLSDDWVTGVSSSAENSGKVRIVEDPNTNNKFLMIMDSVLKSGGNDNIGGGSAFGKENSGYAWATLKASFQSKGTFKFKVVAHAQYEGTDNTADSSYKAPIETAKFYINYDYTKLQEGNPPKGNGDWSNSDLLPRNEVVTVDIPIAGNYNLTWAIHKQNQENYEDLYYIDDISFDPAE